MYIYLHVIYFSSFKQKRRMFLSAFYLSLSGQPVPAPVKNRNFLKALTNSLVCSTTLLIVSIVSVKQLNISKLPLIFFVSRPLLSIFQTTRY